MTESTTTPGLGPHAGAPTADRRTRAWQVGAAAAIPVLLTAWVYRPILNAYFFADDFVCLVSIVNDGFVRFILRPFGGHNLLMRNLAFWGSYRLFGLRADLFFWTVLLTHLANVWLLYRILRMLTGSLLLACVGATLWGTSPVNLGTLGWYSVYGQVLVGTFLLVVLDRMTHARFGPPPSVRVIFAWFGLLLLGTACFGTGIGAALSFPVLTFLLLPATWHDRCQRLTLLALPLVTIAIYFGLRRLSELFEPLTFNEVVAGNFSLPRLWRAIPLLPDFLGVSVDASLRSFYFTGAAHPDSGSRFTWVAFGVSTALLLWHGESAQRRAALGMLALALTVYLVIALGRQPAGDVTATWLASQARYHYVGTIPVVVVAALAARHLGRLRPLRPLPRLPLAVGAFAIGILGYARSDFRVDDHAECRRQLAFVQRGIAMEVLVRAAAGTIDLENHLPTATLQQLLGPVLMHERTLFPGRAAVFILEHPDGALDDRRVRFIERDPAVRAWHARWPNTPLGRLLIAPPQ